MRRNTLMRCNCGRKNVIHVSFMGCKFAERVSIQGSFPQKAANKITRSPFVPAPAPARCRFERGLDVSQTACSFRSSAAQLDLISSACPECEGLSVHSLHNHPRSFPVNDFRRIYFPFSLDTPLVLLFGDTLR